MGTKFTTKFWYVWSRDGVKKAFYRSKRIKQIGKNDTIDRFLFTDFNWKSC